ncbi:MAG: methyltransferase domain-containing protein [Rhodospirillales bacterium]
MTPSCRRRTTCRLCGSSALDKVMQLTPTPPANAFVTKEKLGEAQAAFPLDLHLCGDCAHAQLPDVVDPEILFRNYVYVSGTSPVFVEHFRRYAEDMQARFMPRGNAGFTVDIGSNDGTLLKQFQALGHRVLGVDPAGAIAKQAAEAGVPTLERFFDSALADEIRAAHGATDLVTANNVFAHADDLDGIAEGVRRLLAPQGVFALEVSYLGDVIRHLLFDTIYHEHLAYHSVAPLKRFLAAHGLRLIDVRRVDTHGGSIRAVAAPDASAHETQPSVEAMVAEEKAAGLDRPETFRAFARRVERRRDEFLALVAKLKSQGRRFAGYGAPAKATTLMYHFGVGRELVEFVVDDSAWKQGLYTPGLHVPVLPAQALYDRKPDEAVILAWNFARSIMVKHARFREGGGHFIVPLPSLERH